MEEWGNVPRQRPRQDLAHLEVCDDEALKSLGREILQRRQSGDCSTGGQTKSSLHFGTAPNYRGSCIFSHLWFTPLGVVALLEQIPQIPGLS